MTSLFSPARDVAAGETYEAFCARRKQAHLTSDQMRLVGQFKAPSHKSPNGRELLRSKPEHHKDRIRFLDAVVNVWNHRREGSGKNDGTLVGRNPRRTWVAGVSAFAKA